MSTPMPDAWFMATVAAYTPGGTGQVIGKVRPPLLSFSPPNYFTTSSFDFLRCYSSLSLSEFRLYIVYCLS